MGKGKGGVEEAGGGEEGRHGVVELSRALRPRILAALFVWTPSCWTRAPYEFRAITCFTQHVYPEATWWLSQVLGLKKNEKPIFLQLPHAQLPKR